MHSFCRTSIKLARIEAKEKGIKMPEYGGSTLVGHEQYTVFFGNFYSHYSGCCSFEARSKAIYDFIDQYQNGQIDEQGNDIDKAED